MMKHCVFLIFLSFSIFNNLSVSFAQDQITQIDEATKQKCIQEYKSQRLQEYVKFLEESFPKLQSVLRANKRKLLDLKPVVLKGISPKLVNELIESGPKWDSKDQKIQRDLKRWSKRAYKQQIQTFDKANQAFFGKTATLMCTVNSVLKGTHRRVCGASNSSTELDLELVYFSSAAGYAGVPVKPQDVAVYLIAAEKEIARNGSNATDQIPSNMVADITVAVNWKMPSDQNAWKKRAGIASTVYFRGLNDHASVAFGFDPGSDSLENLKSRASSSFASLVNYDVEFLGDKIPCAPEASLKSDFNPCSDHENLKDRQECERTQKGSGVVAQ